MAVPAQEGQPLEQQIMGVIQETRQTLAESQALFPDDENGKLPAFRDAIGFFGAANLARLSLGERPEGVGAAGLEATTGFVKAKREWIGEQVRRRDADIATMARPLYIAAQNAVLSELVDGEAFTVSRLDNANRDAIRNREGLIPIEGPVTGTLFSPRAELGLFSITPLEEGAEPPAESDEHYFANFLDHHDVVQLDLQVAQA